MRLKDRVVLITGGTSGIGKATAELFAQEGARVVFTGRRVELGHPLANQIGGLYLHADHSLKADCERVVKDVLDKFGQIDILFNNAGIVVRGTAEETSESVWDDVLTLNVTAVWRMSSLVVPVMRAQGGGVIINNASDWGLVGGQEAVAYCTSKGAVVLMTKSMALDHARENIRINAVCPGDTFVDRWVREGYFEDSGAVNQEQARQSDTIPMGRVADAGEIARAVLFLAADDSSFVTGATLVVDGGNTVQRSRPSHNFIEHDTC
jgi:meso-butanediol dehydrogenase/(S,S)-butanediol dehydrogenase/diacetyl reductase